MTELAQKLLDERFMQQALLLAKKGYYSTNPNPAVGCIIVKEGEVVAKGWHQQAGMPHAERMALADAKQKGVSITGATVYVTLEPCSHYGRTPPCADGLIEANIARCVVAILDPNPDVAGKGVERLEKAGIKVNVGVLQTQAENLNTAFLFAMRHQRSYVRLKMASSLDGRTAMANGESQWITGEHSRFEVHKLRAQSAAILTGIGTILADNPSLTVRLPAGELSKMHLDLSQAQPLRVILDAQLKIPLTSKLLSAMGRTLIVCSQSTLSNAKDKVESLRKIGVEVVAQPTLENRRFELKTLLETLFKTYQINSVLVESGATLAGSFVRQGLVDELHSYIAPSLLGSNARAMFDLPELEAMNDKIEFKIQDVQQFGQDLRVIMHPSR